jgi:murein peptide amidase A
MNILTNTVSSRSSASLGRSAAEFLDALNRRAARSASLVTQLLGVFEGGGAAYPLVRYDLLGPRGGSAPLRIAIFAGIHGDEPEGCYAVAQFLQLLESRPELATGYCLSFYPICNPTGFEDRTRETRDGVDLNREFWRESQAPEVRLLEEELRLQRFDGLIALHSDDTSEGLYGFVRGPTLTEHLLRPALAAAEALLPINQNQLIDGFHARDGLIRDCYTGVLSAPPDARPRPFEIILETPGRAPAFIQQCAAVVALQTILAEYRKFIAYAANL